MKLPLSLLHLLSFTLLCCSLPARAQSTGDRRITAGDTISVRVYQEPELDTQVVVGASGRISVQLAGPVSVAGLTSEAAAKAIEAAYLDGYLKHPNVTVTVGKATPAATEAAARKHFSITGQVVSPKTYYLPDDGKLSLLQAIGFAGGTTRIANLSKVTIVRGSQTIKVDAKKLAKEGGAPVYLQPGDVVNVPEGW